MIRSLRLGKVSVFRRVQAAGAGAEGDVGVTLLCNWQHFHRKASQRTSYSKLPVTVHCQIVLSGKTSSYFWPIADKMALTESFISRAW
jgi:hypothetical protein